MPDGSSEAVFLASQAFDSALLMVGLERWPQAIIQMCVGVELILRSYVNERGTFEELIDAMRAKENISEQLTIAAHRLRILRNNYVHELGRRNPQKDEEAIIAFFQNAIPTFKVYTERATGLNPLTFLSPDELYNTFVFTMNLFKTPPKGMKASFAVAVLVRTIANIINDSTATNWQLELQHSDLGRDLIHDASDSHAETHLDGFENELIKLGYIGVRCPAYPCIGEITVVLEIDKQDEISSAYCPYCDLLIVEPNLLEKYVSSKISAESLATLVSRKLR